MQPKKLEPTRTLHALAGVYAAAVTPLKADFSLALDDLPELLDFLERRGCHGVLLFGTTGEGPSFDPTERLTLLQEALTWRRSHPHFHLLLGTGTPSLEETIALTKASFDQGVDGVVVLPPYYYKKITDDGLFAWYSQVLHSAVPADGALLGYHIPRMTGIGLSIELVARLKDAFPDRFAGLKDSSNDPELINQLAERFGADLLVLNGDDTLFSRALSSTVSGCITALANLYSPELRLIWEAHQNGAPEAALIPQQKLTLARSITDRYQPAPPVLKGLLRRNFHLPTWSVLPPLLPISADLTEQIARELGDTN
jgi:4-hydroxy-tetrahydrodipicolinate synthase